MNKPVTAAPEAVPAAPTPAAEPLNVDSLAAMFQGGGEPPAEGQAPADGQNRDPATGRFTPKPGEQTAEQPAGAAAQQTEQTPESESAKPKGDATDPDDIKIEDGAEEAQPPVPLDAPASWPAELKPAFAKLTPAEQKSLAEWQGKRDRDIDAMVNGAKEATQKAQAELEPERAKVRNHLSQLQQALQHYANPKIAAFKAEFADVLSGKVTPLQLADPNGQHRYAEDGTDRYERFNAYQAEFAQLQRTADRVNAEAAAGKKADFEKFRTTETAKYREQHKLTDDTAWEAHNEALTKFAESQGFKLDELAHADARHMNVIRAAMEASNGSKAEADFAAHLAELGLKDVKMTVVEAAKRYAKALAGKRKAEANPQRPAVPQVAKPGVSQPQPGALEAKKSAFKSATSKPMSIDALADAFRKAG